jgi:hypothetical protein
METVHAIRSVPSEVRSTIYRVNALRNALAHSFFPENRKEYRKAGRVLYLEKDIRSPDGLHTFILDCEPSTSYLARRAYGKWLGVKEGEGKWD